MRLDDIIARGVATEKADWFRRVIKATVKPDWEKGPWVAGGCVRRLISNTEPFASDIDVFFSSEEQKNEWVERINSSEKYKCKSQKSNDHNTTLEADFVTDDAMHTIKLQAIHIQYYQSPQEVIDSFDYTICQFVTDGEEFLAGDYSLYDLSKNRLVVHRISYGVASLRRMMKYGNQDFKVCSGAMASLLQAVADNPELIHQEIEYID